MINYLINSCLSIGGHVLCYETQELWSRLTGLKKEQPNYRVAGSIRALPLWNEVTIRSFVFGVGMGDPETEAIGTEKICRITTSRSH